MAEPATKRTHLRLVSAEEPSRRCDPQIEHAARLMTEHPEEPWTVTRLGRRVGMSRAVFARRFRAHMGCAPHRYLTRCRMDRAAALLTTSEALPDAGRSLAEVAARVGYTSEFAFNRAFRRHFGVPPGAYRRGRRSADAPVCLAA